jgi:predicted GTPase
VENDAAHDELDSATAEAVGKSVDEMAKIKVRVDFLTDLLNNTADEVRARRASDDENDPCMRLSSQLNRSRGQVADLFQRQSEALQTFNIVLFGRTGAGKSTLISAMTRSNGESVSPYGESDWTAMVEPLDWHSCRIYDTPGINGWGRRECREDLETRAREAVEVADLVLVCFDSQSQQADEFRKLAAWVHSYRKPMIAVFNSRNPIWRLPNRVPVGSARANLSRAVREHAGNIRDELAKIGLTGVPVIALSSKRALFGRASLPFEGPDVQTLEKQREAYGTERLESWSGYPRLVGLVVRAICEHAVQLRIGALNDQLRGIFSGLKRTLGEIKQEASQAAETLENDLIASLLKLLGYPPENDPGRRQPFLEGERDLLAELERHRGGAFQAPVDGEFYQFVSQLLDSKLEALRSRSLQKAEECVLSAFDRKEKLSADNVREASFDEPKMKNTAEAVLQEGSEFLDKRVDLAVRDTKLDLKVLSRAAAVEGDEGSGWKYSSWALRAGGILSGAAGALGALALANIWNPVGWATAVAAGVALIGGLAATFLGWLGGKAREKAEQKRLAARRQAVGEVRRNIHEVYDQFRDTILEHAHSHALEASREVLLGPIKHALVLRSVQQQCQSLSEEIQNLSKGLSRSTEPQSLLCEVTSTIEKEEYPDCPNAGLMHWLGEDWIDDPTGLEVAHGSTESGRTTAYDPKFFERLFSGLRGIFEHVAGDLSPGSGEKWLTTALDRCADDPIAVEKLSELKDIADDGRPRIHLVGDYNAGKTSFIKRLLMDAGSPIPKTLEVGASPTTDTTGISYDWNGVLLIDSPGFQSGEVTHTETALRAFPDAAAVIFLFQPNLILGDDECLRTILRGCEARGLVPKQDRTFFIVNRSDELGVDPETSPDVYRQLVESKKNELSMALASRNIAVGSSKVFCMASDPFGLAGNRKDVDASAFDPYRDWDGFDYFMTAFRRVRTKLLRTGLDRSLLEGGVARLARLQSIRAADLEKLKAQDEALDRLRSQLTEAIDEGARLVAKHHADLKRKVSDHVAGLVDEILAEQDPEQLKSKAEHLNEWYKDKALLVELTHWAKVTSNSLNSWGERNSEAIQRRLDSPEFRIAFSVQSDGGPDLPDAANSKGLIREVADKAGRSLSAATQKGVYRIGKELGFKFKPWGAAKLAKSLAKAGAVIAIVGVVFDIAAALVEERRQKERERVRKKLAQWLQESEPPIVKAVGFGDKDDPGALRNFESAIRVVKKFEREQRGLGDDLVAKMQDVRRKMDIYDELVTDAVDLLGNPWEVS